MYGPLGVARATTQSVLRDKDVPHLELIVVMPEGRQPITLVKDGKPVLTSVRPAV